MPVPLLMDDVSGASNDSQDLARMEGEEVEGIVFGGWIKGLHSMAMISMLAGMQNEDIEVFFLLNRRVMQA